MVTWQFVTACSYNVRVPSIPIFSYVLIVIPIFKKIPRFSNNCNLEVSWDSSLENNFCSRNLHVNDHLWTYAIRSAKSANFLM